MSTPNDSGKTHGVDPTDVASLQGQVLRVVHGTPGDDYRHAVFLEHTFHGDFSRAQFQGARLIRCMFEAGTDLTGADFTAANLSDTDLSKTRNLSEQRLGVANLAYATLPHQIASLPRFGEVKELAARIEKVIFTLIAACATVIILVWLVPDEQLFRTSGTVDLPVLKIGVPVAPFCLLAPWLLLIAHTYLLSSLGKLWTGIRDLPAILPSNRALFRDVPSFPNFFATPFGRFWPINDKDEGSSEKATEEFERITRSDRALVSALTGVLVPVTIAAVWLKYLRLHEAVGTGVQLIAFALSIFFALRGSALMRIRLTRGLDWAAQDGATTPRTSGRVRISKIFFGHASLLTVPEDPHGPSIPGDDVDTRHVRNRVIVAATLCITALPVVVSLLATRSEGCRSFEVALDPMRLFWNRVSDPVRLLSHDETLLSHALCYSFAAQLKQTRLDSLRLDGANLRRASLGSAELDFIDAERAIFDGAQFGSARIRHGDLRDAKFHGALFWEARLDSAVLKDAIFTDADLRGASFVGARLQGADLTGADLTGADFRGAIVCGAKIDPLAANNPANALLLARAFGADRMSRPLVGVASPQAREIDDTADGPRYLNEREHAEYRKWRAATLAAGFVAYALRSSVDSAGTIDRKSALEMVASIDVSNGQTTQLHQMELEAAITNAHGLPRGGARIRWTSVEPLLTKFVTRVSEKARDHCVAGIGTR
jgi:uncharacterized protein YjbI with pentapeptide repeats